MYELIKPQNWQLQSKTHFFLTDLDGTLAASASGRLFSQSVEDTVFFHGTREFINKYKELGYTILIVSNQSNYNNAIREKFEYVVDTLNVPAFIATHKHSPYRKPSKMSYEAFLKLHNINKDEVEKLHYTGDAVGPADVNPMYRWASSDKEFADAICATFHRPIDIIPQWSYEPLLERVTASSNRTIFLLIGTPGSGKSTLINLLTAKFPAGSSIHIEQDCIGTRAMVLREIKKSIQNSDIQYIFVDATHGSLKRRTEVYELASKYNWRVQILWAVRDGRPYNALRAEHIVPPVAYGVYTKYFDNPLNDGYPVEIIN